MNKKWPKDLVGEVTTWLVDYNQKTTSSMDSVRSYAEAMLTAINDHYEIKIPEPREYWIEKLYLKKHTYSVRLIPPSDEDGPRKDWIHVKEVLDES